jgi:hypothetical protein
MAEGVHWIKDGRIDTAPELGSRTPLDERNLLHREGYVKITEDETGTTVRWAMFSANWSSLYFAMECIHDSEGPFCLQYHSAGWFNERLEHSWEAADRIGQLIQKSDIHLSQTIYMQDAKPQGEDVPLLLKKAIEDRAIDEDHSIDCVFDPASHKFHVTRVGHKSTIAQVYGLSPVSYPCLTGHSYDQAVSRAYTRVIQTGIPHYDHIYAAMSSPAGDVFWVPYQRVVLPLKTNRGKRGVRIVTEVTKVDISIL